MTAEFVDPARLLRFCARMAQAAVFLEQIGPVKTMNLAANEGALHELELIEMLALLQEAGVIRQGQQGWLVLPDCRIEDEGAGGCW